MSLPSVQMHLVFGLSAAPATGLLMALVNDWLRGLARWGLGLSAAECTEHLDPVSDVRREAAADTTTRMP